MQKKYSKYWRAADRCKCAWRAVLTKYSPTLLQEYWRAAADSDWPALSALKKPLKKIRQESEELQKFSKIIHRLLKKYWLAAAHSDWSVVLTLAVACQLPSSSTNHCLNIDWFVQKCCCLEAQMLMPSFFAAASESPDDPERSVHPVARLARPRAPRWSRLPWVWRGECHGRGCQASRTGESSENIFGGSFWRNFLLL